MIIIERARAACKNVSLLGCIITVCPGAVLSSSRDRKSVHDMEPPTGWRSSKINRRHDVTTPAYQTVAIMYYSFDRDEMIFTRVVIEAASRRR
jgi:hypothetical protein